MIGNKKRFRNLYDRYHAKIYHIILKRVKSEHDAKDLTQSVFIRLWTNQKYLHLEEITFSLLYTITKNVIIDFYKQKLDFVELEQTEDPSYSQFFDFSEDPESRFEKLNRCIEQLPEQRKIVFLLSKKEGLTAREIADHLSISKRTVETHIYLAIKSLRDMMISVLILWSFVSFSVLVA